MISSCRLLEWDTEFFGMRTARVNESRIPAPEFAAILDWCRVWQIRCLYLLTDADAAETSRAAEDNGFHLIDIRATLEVGLDGIAHGGFAAEGIRPFTESDIAPLIEIARTSHTNSRFYRDPGFARERCDALYGLWIEKSCRGSAQAVFVALRSGKPAGYITCQTDGESGSIGLFAVAEWARGEGLGGRLVNRSLSYFRELGLKRATVVTQGGNTLALRLYEQQGFQLHSVALWYHRWFDDESKP